MLIAHMERVPRRLYEARLREPAARTTRISFAILALIICWASLAYALAAPREGRIAPAFTLPDTENMPRKLWSFRGRPTLLCFFCGCQYCHECAAEWSQMQRSGVLTAPKAAETSQRPKSASHHHRPKIEYRKTKPENPHTVVVYTGDRDAARAFAVETGLDPAQTVVLSDVDYKVTQSYNALPCPRLCVLDTGGVLRYINNHADDAPQKATATTILSHVVDSLRALRR